MISVVVPLLAPQHITMAIREHRMVIQEYRVVVHQQLRLKSGPLALAIADQDQVNLR